MKDDFGSGLESIKGGQISRNGLWKCIYNGYGNVGVIKTPEPKVVGNGTYCLSLRPQINNNVTMLRHVTAQSLRSFALPLILILSIGNIRMFSILSTRYKLLLIGNLRM